MCRPAADTIESSSVLQGAVARTYASDQWQAIEGACKSLYIPTAEDVGLKLRVRCTPARWAVNIPFQALRRENAFAVRCLAHVLHRAW